MKSQINSKAYLHDPKQLENEKYEEFDLLGKNTIPLNLHEKSVNSDKYLPHFLLDDSDIFSKNTAQYEIHEANETDVAFDFTGFEKSMEDLKTENSSMNPFSSDNEV